MREVRPVVSTVVAAWLVLAGLAQPASAGAGASPDTLRTVPMSRQSGPRTVPGRVLLRFKAGRAPARASSIGAESFSGDVAGWRLAQLRPNETADQAIARLSRDPSVAAVTADHVYHSMSVPNDTLFGLQWGMQNTGQQINGDAGLITGTAGADISAPSAWDTTTGSSSVIVAVVDSGVASTHPDLHPNVVAGYNFVGDRGSTSDTHDVLGHGTHVAGIIGAASGDGYGVTGVSPHVTILPVRALDDSGSGDTVAIASAFDYAAAHGAKVVNASLGGPDPDPVLEHAIAGNPNTLFVVAAGNNHSNDDTTPDYPCNYAEANLICVAASDQNDALASFSNFGPASVDLAAPGENIASTFVPDPAGYGGSGYSLTDSPNGGYANNADTWAQSSSTIDPQGRSDCSLNYKLRARLSPNDIFTAETSPASSPGPWVAVDTFGNGLGATTGGSFVSRTTPVAGDGLPFHLRFRLVSDAAGTNDGVYVDNVAVVCGSTTIYGIDGFGSTLTGWTTGGTSHWGTTSVAGTWAYMSGTSMATPLVSGAAALLWAKYPSASVSAVKAAILGSADKLSALNGITVSGGRLDVAKALQTIDGTPPTGVAFTGAGLKPYQLASSFGLGWTATDTGSGVKSFDVRYERAPYNGTFGPWVTWKSGVTNLGNTFSSAPGYSYCFEVRARDNMLNTSAWSAPRCTEFPVNDRQLTVAGHWSRATSSSRYLGTDSYTTSKNATLSLAKASFRRMDLVVTVCKGCGSIAVYVGSVYYGTFSTNASSLGARHLVLVRSSSHVIGPSTITIKVVTSGLPIAIEGLGLLRY